MATAAGNILLIWDRAGDYHIARFKALEKIHPGRVFLADLGAADSLYGWKNSLENHPHFSRLSQVSVEVADTWTRFRTFTRLVKREHIECVGIAGYGRVEYILMLFWLAWKRKKVVLFAESWYGNNEMANLLKEWLLRWTCKGILVSGVRAHAHFKQKLNLEEMPIQEGYSVVDNEHFASDKTVEKENILLCVARFAPEKNLEMLIQAFAKSKLAETWKLSLVGGGPLKESLVRLANGHPAISFHNWLSYEALPILYAQARFFVLPSRFEPWGLVVNEAMAAGLPVLVSDACGCAPDLIGDENGYVFNETNEADLTLKLNKITELSPEQTSAMGGKSLEKIARFSPETWAQKFLLLAFG